MRTLQFCVETGVKIFLIMLKMGMSVASLSNKLASYRHNSSCTEIREFVSIPCTVPIASVRLSIQNRTGIDQITNCSRLKYILAKSQLHGGIGKVHDYESNLFQC